VTEISDWSDLETQLQETKDLLGEIEQRFHQVRRDSLEQMDLQQQQQNLQMQIQEISGDRPHPKNNSQNNSKIRRKPKPNNGESISHKDELHRQFQEISDRLEQLEADLESRLLSWSSLREPFWQIVRFGGLGVVIGVILKSCAG
jgi:DNA repair exonuclease SbcCD ATPase subunit